MLKRKQQQRSDFLEQLVFDSHQELLKFSRQRRILSKQEQQRSHADSGDLYSFKLSKMLLNMPRIF